MVQSELQTVRWAYYQNFVDAIKDTDPALLASEYFLYTTLDDNAEYGFNIAEVCFILYELTHN